MVAHYSILAGIEMKAKKEKDWYQLHGQFVRGTALVGRGGEREEDSCVKA